MIILAKFRQNHTRTGKRPFSGLLIRVILLAAILVVFFVALFEFTNFSRSSEDIPIDLDPSDLRLMPRDYSSEVIDHGYYQLGYNEDHEQADWAAYVLTKSSLQIPNVPRSDYFIEDPLVRTTSAHHRDYSNSGYSRGHLVPAGDLAFNEEAMEASFYMSNMSPQLRAFNGGVWRELEECVRDWAYEKKSILVATGPVFGNVTEYIGKTSQVRVPSAFFKIVVDLDNQEGIGFLLDHSITDRPLSEFASSIDDIEEAINMDFFDHLYSGEASEKRIEGTINLDVWPISQKRYRQRVEIWNKN